MTIQQYIIQNYKVSEKCNLRIIRSRVGWIDGVYLSSSQDSRGQMLLTLGVTELPAQFLYPCSLDVRSLLQSLHLSRKGREPEWPSRDPSMQRPATAFQLMPIYVAHHSPYIKLHRSTGGLLPASSHHCSWGDSSTAWSSSTLATDCLPVPTVPFHSISLMQLTTFWRVVCTVERILRWSLKLSPLLTHPVYNTFLLRLCTTVLFIGAPYSACPHTLLLLYVAGKVTLYSMVLEPETWPPSWISHTPNS